MTSTAPLIFTRLQRDSGLLHDPYVADYKNLENGMIFEEGTGIIRAQSELQELVELTKTLDMEEADQADAHTLNYILEKWVRYATGFDTGND